MTWRRPFYSVGLLFNISDEGHPAFLGTCFAYGSNGSFLTAAHCLGNLEAHQLGILLPIIDQEDFNPIKEVIKHETADVAFLRLDPIEAPELLPFLGLSAIHTWGEHVQALGFAEESSEEEIVPTARWFSGIIQRLYTHQSWMGYEYKAGELSFGAPAGLSGGPVFTAHEEDRIVGLVAENHDSTTFLRSVAEVQEGGNLRSEKIHEVIRYGIFVELSSLRNWLEQNGVDVRTS
jgi:hypothetical protein